MDVSPFVITPDGGGGLGGERGAVGVVDVVDMGDDDERVGGESEGDLSSSTARELAMDLFTRCQELRRLEGGDGCSRERRALRLGEAKRRFAAFVAAKAFRLQREAATALIKKLRLKRFADVVNISAVVASSLNTLVEATRGVDAVSLEPWTGLVSPVLSAGVALGLSILRYYTIETRLEQLSLFASAANEQAGELEGVLEGLNKVVSSEQLEGLYATAEPSFRRATALASEYRALVRLTDSKTISEVWRRLSLDALRSEQAYRREARDIEEA